MTQGKPEETCGDHGGKCVDGSPCGRAAGWGTPFETGRCRACQGTNPDGTVADGHGRGNQQNNDNAVTHGLHQSAETFFSNAEEHHLDNYYALHESLCQRFEIVHGSEPMYHDNKELAEVAFEMAKLDMAKEYEKEHAVNPDKPITERQTRDVGGTPMDVETISKVESLKTEIRRENRLALKDKGIYQSPEKELGKGIQDLASVFAEDLEH